MTAKEPSSQRAADDLYERYLSHVLKFFRRKGLKHPDVDDVMQDTYLRLRSAHDLEGVSDPQRYLIGIASRVLLEHRKRREDQRAVPALSDEVDEYDAESESALESEGERDLLFAVLFALPESLRAPWVLHMRGLSHKEIAHILGLSVSTIRSRLARALVVFLRELKADANNGRSGI